MGWAQETSGKSAFGGFLGYIEPGEAEMLEFPVGWEGGGERVEGVSNPCPTHGTEIPGFPRNLEPSVPPRCHPGGN